MNDSPCDFTVSRQLTLGSLDFIRLEAKDGRKLLVRIDLSCADFLSAIQGSEVVAAISAGPKA